MKTHASIHPGIILREDFLIPLNLQRHHNQQAAKAEMKATLAGIRLSAAL